MPENQRNWGPCSAKIGSRNPLDSSKMFSKNSNDRMELSVPFQTPQIHPLRSSPLCDLSNEFLINCVGLSKNRCALAYLRTFSDRYSKSRRPCAICRCRTNHDNAAGLNPTEDSPSADGASIGTSRGISAWGHEVLQKLTCSLNQAGLYMRPGHHKGQVSLDSAL
jgi:hypothetical protein